MCCECCGSLAGVELSGMESVLRVIGVIALLGVAFRVVLNIYRRLILRGKDPLSYGKWVIVTGLSQSLPLLFSLWLAPVQL